MLLLSLLTTTSEKMEKYFACATCINICQLNKQAPSYIWKSHDIA